MRKLTILAVFAGFIFSLLFGLFTAAPSYASGVGSGGAGGGGGGGGGGCSAFNTEWAFSTSVPAVGSGCTGNKLTGSACHTDANVGTWIFSVRAINDPDNNSKYISLPPSNGFQYMKNSLTALIQDNGTISKGFNSAYKSWDTGANENLVQAQAESVISNGTYGDSGNKWGYNGGNTYRDDAGHWLTYICVWDDYTPGGPCDGVCLKPPVQYCDDYGVTSAKYVIQKGTNVSTTKATSTADALAQCALHCPTSTSADPNNISQYLDHPGAVITAGYDTGDKQGQYCYTRNSVSHSESQFQTKVTGSTVTSAPVVMNRTTIVQGDDGTSQRTHPGPTKFVGQTASADTAWGTMLNNLTGCPSAATQAAAISTTNSQARPSVALSAANKQAEAEGGIMDTSEVSVYATVANNTTVKTPQESDRTVTISYAFTLTNTGAEYGVGDYDSGYPKTTYGAWSAWEQSGTSTSSCAPAPAPSTPETTGFYQTYTNHCDAADYQSNLTGTALDTGDSTKNYSASFVTPTLENSNGMTLGYGLGDREGQFNKLCSYLGKQSNGGVANVSFFRDNVQHTYTVAHYTPVSGGVVTYNGEAAIATSVSLWSGGSPKAPGVNNGGQFQLFMGANAALSSTPTIAPVLKDWEAPSAYQSQTLGVTQGDYSTFGMAADWPSVDGMPNVFTVKWIYAPTLSTTALLTAGFSTSDNAAYSTGTLSTPIYGEVYGTAGASSPLLTDRVAATTGGQTSASSAAPVNTMDGNLAFGTSVTAGRWSMEPSSYSGYYHVVKFVRAVGN